ncbi:MAG TPA: hypothetical protein EYN97_07610 [Candidatus Lambdaproteobacteria bacterium]|nr:hypothetical protein [Candidatus Lambdaproteobacteria bacterium]
MPVYLQFAVFAGLCFGGTSYPESRVQLASSSRFQVSSNNSDQKSEIRNQKLEINKLAWSLVGIGLLGVLCAFYYASSISWGGYGFDPTSTAFNRWFRPKGVIAASPDSLDKDYSLYWGNLNQLKQENILTSIANSTDVWLRENTLYLKNGSKWNPRQYVYVSQKQVGLPQRIVSFDLNQPPGQTNVILLAQKGVYPWELSGSFTKGIYAGRWCEQSCRLLIYRPNNGNKPHGMILQMPLTGLNENRPVRTILTMQPITREILPSVSKKDIQQILNATFTKKSTNKEFVFRQPEDVHQLPVDFQEHKLWLISLKTDPASIPKEHDPNSSDSRKLGVRVLF